MPERKNQKRRATANKPALMDIRTVADRANVSIATVSRTINHVPTVNAKMAKRVWEAIRELNYFPNTQARALVSGRSGLLGLIVRRMLERKAEGVAVMTFGIEEPLLDQLAERNIPMVFVDVGPDRPGISVLKVDYHHGIRQGVQHLAALGHRNIAFVSGPARLHSAQSRVAAFSKSLEECGIPLDPSWIVEGDHTLEGGILAMGKLLEADTRPTALMCSNDMTAIGVLHKAYRAGLQIPDDLSIIGFDDIQMARVTIPPLTSIHMSRLDLARAAVTALRAHLEGTGHEREYKIDTRLVVRESTAKAAQ